MSFGTSNHPLRGLHRDARCPWKALSAHAAGNCLCPSHRCSQRAAARMPQQGPDAHATERHEGSARPRWQTAGPGQAGDCHGAAGQTQCNLHSSPAQLLCQHVAASLLAISAPRVSQQGLALAGHFMLPVSVLDRDPGSPCGPTCRQTDIWLHHAGSMLIHAAGTGRRADELHYTRKCQDSVISGALTSAAKSGQQHRLW